MRFRGNLSDIEWALREILGRTISVDVWCGKWVALDPDRWDSPEEWEEDYIEEEELHIGDVVKKVVEILERREEAGGGVVLAKDLDDLIEKIWRAVWDAAGEIVGFYYNCDECEVEELRSQKLRFRDYRDGLRKFKKRFLEEIKAGEIDVFEI